MIIGIDPGCSGALVAIDAAGKVLDHICMPTVKVGTKSRVNGAHVACFLRYYREIKGKEWRTWVESELMKMPNQEQVRTALNLRSQGSK